MERRYGSLKVKTPRTSGGDYIVVPNHSSTMSNDKSVKRPSIPNRTVSLQPFTQMTSSERNTCFSKGSRKIPLHLPVNSIWCFLLFDFLQYWAFCSLIFPFSTLIFCCCWRWKMEKKKVILRLFVESFDKEITSVWPIKQSTAEPGIFWGGGGNGSWPVWPVRWVPRLFLWALRPAKPLPVNAPLKFTGLAAGPNCSIQRM